MRRMIMRKHILSAERKLDDGIQPFHMRNEKALAALFYNGFQDTIDSEFTSRSAYLTELHALINGKYGEFLPSCSFLSQTEGEVKGAAMVTLFRSVPLLAYVVTAPEWQGKGIAGDLIRYCEQALIQKGYETFYLVVTKQNYRAVSVYRRLGFQEAGDDWEMVLEGEKHKWWK